MSDMIQGAIDMIRLVEHIKEYKCNMEMQFYYLPFMRRG